MKDTLNWLVGLFVAALLAAACGGSSSSPVSPTPAQAPAPTLTFEADVSSPSGAALSVQRASRGHEAGKVSVAITAHNLSNVYKVRGELRWDPTILDFDAWGEGDWFKQGGALVDWTFFRNKPGEVSLFLDRPTTLPPAEGSGEIFIIRFRPKAGVIRGSSRLQWNEPRLFDADFRRVTPSSIYAGTITIQ